MSDTNITAVVGSLHNSLIARHGLRDAVAIVRELHRYVETTLQEQIRRHPKEWPEYAQMPGGGLAVAVTPEKKSLPIPRVRG